jgi:multimeric flavodoxin WrbA
MKIVAIMGSPHKGNTLDLTGQFETSLKNQKKDLEFDYILLKDLEIKECRGCFACFVKGEERCPLKDDINMVLEKMEGADGVVFVTPVYSLHVSYLLKKFIDRLSYTFHRPRFFGKYAVAITAAGNPGLGVKETLKYLKGVSIVWGFEFVDQLGFVAPPKNTSIRAIATQKDRTDEVAKKFITALEEKKPRKLSFTDHIWFRTMQSLYSLMEDMSPVDYQYFLDHGWFNKKKVFFHDHVRAGFFKDRLARLMGWFTRKQVQKALSKTA